MRRPHALAVLILAAGCAPAESVAPVDGSDDRICSVSLMGDELLSLLVPADRIACVSSLADEPQHSNVAGLFPHRIPRLAARIEPILSQRPDLVIAAPWNDKSLLELLERSRVPSLVLREVDDFEGIFDQTEELGRRLDASSQAERVVAEARARLADLSAALEPVVRRPSVLSFSHSVVAGAETTTDQLIRAAGGENAAATMGIAGHTKLSIERILTADFDVLLLGFDPGKSADEILAAYPHLEATRAVREGRVVVLAPRYTTTVSPYLVEGAIRLASALHPQLDVPSSRGP